MKRILITGANSYIGDSVRDYLLQEPDSYSVTIKDTIGWNPKPSDFEGYDVVFNVAGIAHIKETKKNRPLYYAVNRDLAISIAQAAKEAGVKQFILLSTMSVYGMTTGYITKSTKPNPVNAYGKSKLQADRAINKIAKESNGEFQFACLRPPMVYGKGCKGNYQTLRNFALKSPIFPNYNNQRSMIYIGNLCEFVKQIIDQKKSGLFFPQNAEYVNTSNMVELIAKYNKKHVSLTSVFNTEINLIPIDIFRKVFGNLTYSQIDSISKYSFEQSIIQTEDFADRKDRKKALCIASMASNLDNFNRPNVEILQSLSYEVTLAANFHSKEDTNSQKKIERFVDEMRNQGVNIVHIDFSRSPKKIWMQIKSILQVRGLLKQKFDTIHCHSPICAAIVRGLAQRYRKEGCTKVLYTAHGFHFYDGAPKINWLVYFPVEWWMSRYTDVLFTINKEDYYRAKKCFKAKRVVYVPGAGVDIEKFMTANRGNKVREELGINTGDIMLLSVGELNSNKNHEAVVRALGQMKSEGNLPDNLYYVIAGIGDKEEFLRYLIAELELEKCVMLVGYHEDIENYYDAANIFIFPSYREGLSISLMEAMASRLPVICSRIRGNIDLIDSQGGCFFEPDNIHEIADAIKSMLKADRDIYGAYNFNKIRGFDLKAIKELLLDLYRGI